MNSEEPILVMHFQNRCSRSQLTSRVFRPIASEQGPHLDDMATGSWTANFECNLDGTVTRDYVGGSTWLQALLLAFEGATKPLIGNEADWENLDGCPAWVLIPKLVPIGWGYDLYKRVLDFSNAEQVAINERIAERRRQAGEPD